MNGPQTIEGYLDALAEALTVSPARARRVLREAEDHLRDAAAAMAEEGGEPLEAERVAIERFGSAETVARSFTGESVAWLPLAKTATGSLLGVAVHGLIAIGLSGLIVLAFGASFGRQFVAGDASGVTYTPVRCSEYFALEPSAKNCSDAAVRHHYGEIVDSRLFAGVLGLFGLAALWVVKRRRGSERLPALFPLTVGVSIFGVAALGLLFLSAPGAGQSGASLSGAIVAAAVAAVYALRLAKVLRPATE